MQLSRRSHQKFADLAASYGTVRKIEDAYAAEDFLLPPDYDHPESGQRRSICAAAEESIDWTDEAANQRLLRVYLGGVEDWGRDTFSVTGGDSLIAEARALVRSLQQDGGPVDDDGRLVLGAAPPPLAVERFDRLSEPRVLMTHLDRITASIGDDPAAAIGSSKELVESALKFVLDDYGVAYSQTASLTDLYKLVAAELALSRESVPNSAKGSATAHRILQNLSTAVQGLAELRNELGIGHGKTSVSPALARHARLASNAARTVVEFVLETWHEREQSGQSK